MKGGEGEEGAAEVAPIEVEGLGVSRIPLE